MTEEEALERWCPFARVIQTTHWNDAVAGAAINRWVIDEEETRLPAGTKCIGSQCMAWREFRNAPGNGRCGMVPPAGS